MGGVAVQAVNVTALQAVLTQQGQKHHSGPAPSPPTPPAPLHFECHLDRCIGVAKGGSDDASCASRCDALAAGEWLANDCCGPWASKDGVLTALKDSFLKKSTANSWDLPASMVLAAKKG